MTIDQAIAQLAGSEGFWKSDTEDRLRSAAQYLTSNGVTDENVVADTLLAVWGAAGAEYGA